MHLLEWGSIKTYKNVVGVGIRLDDVTSMFQGGCFDLGVHLLEYGPLESWWGS